MNDLTFLGGIANEPVALLMLLIIAGFKIIELIYKKNRKLPFFRKGKKKGEPEAAAEPAETDHACFDSRLCALEKRCEKHLTDIESYLRESKADSEKDRQEANRRFSELGSNIEKIFEIIEDNEDKFKKVTQETLLNKLFNTSRAPFIRLRAFRALIAMAKNGRVWEEGFKLVLEYKEEWRNVLETELEVEIADRDYYKKRMEDIENKIYYK